MTAPPSPNEPAPASENQNQNRSAASASRPCSLPIDRLLQDCDIERTRASGPGGQHRNKVETAIVITHRPTGVVGQASESRQQARNQQQAIARLRVNLALAVRLEAQTPSDLWRSRVRGNKVKISPQHFDFAALLAEAMDHVAANDFEVREAAIALSISTSQLIKLLKTEPAAFQWLNQNRIRLGLHKIH